MWRLIAIFCSVILAASLVQGSGNPHTRAHACRLDFKSDCDSVCLICHSPSASAPVVYPTPWDSGGLPLHEILADPQKAAQTIPQVARVIEDIAICTGCHTTMGGTGDHPVDIGYQSAVIALIANPDGPKLLCTKSGGPCRLQCYTCHDPHANDTGLLRKRSNGASLCIACHPGVK